MTPNALKTLENGLERFPNAPAIERSKVYLYRVELAQSSLALARAIELTQIEQGTIADEFGHVATLLRELET